MSVFLRSIGAALFTLIFVPSKGFSTPVELKLDASASRVDFSVTSQMINTSGSIADYSGVFLYDPENVENSKLEFTADASSASFGQLPFDQMILMTGLMKSIQNPEVSFVSNSIKQISKNKIIVAGTAYAGRKGEAVSIPLELSEMSLTNAIMKGSYQRSGLIGSKNNPQSKLFGTINCRSLFKFVFKR